MDCALIGKFFAIRPTFSHKVQYLPKFLKICTENKSATWINVLNYISATKFQEVTILPRKLNYFKQCLFMLVLGVMLNLLIGGCASGGGSYYNPQVDMDQATSNPEIPTVNPEVTPLSPQVQPSNPSTIPPKTANHKVVAKKLNAKTDTCKILLPKGWSLVSFPFATLQSISGLEYQLNYYKDQKYVTVDPTVDPQKLDTTLAYWAYTEAETTIEATGEINEGKVSSVKLQTGWNLIGCPYHENLPFANMSVSRQGSSLRTLEQATSMSTSQDTSWLYRYVLISANNESTTSMNLANSSAALRMGGAHWFFAWNEASINLNVGVTNAPQINSVSGSYINAGDTVTIEGSNFGSLEEDDGLITINGVIIEAENIESWTNSTIRFKVPIGVKSGYLVVFKNTCPSNAYSVYAGNAQTTAQHSVYGLVTDEEENPIEGAQITLDSGHSTLSDANGEFNLYDVPAGQYLCYVSHIGYNTGVSQVTIEANATRRIRAVLSVCDNGTSGGDSGEEMGVLHIKAYKRQYDGKTYRVAKIKVSESGDYGNRWIQSWETLEPYRELKADGAIIGRRYNVAITWIADGQTPKLFGHHTVKLTQSSQNESFEN